MNFPIDSYLIDKALLLPLIHATILGLIIGFERERVGKSVGKRTFSLVVLGSCLFTLISVEVFPDNPVRIASQIVSGIGFLGVGVIWRHKGKGVHGITTAADMWVSAAIGMAVATRLYLTATLTTLLILLVLRIPKKSEEAEPEED
ncbi:MAG: MgtC/SapB family protein [Candidatus Altiarchaeales archaeon]|nr:MgtC/SapB family protein [Candidatus Altiarchaeales archaeon]